MERLDFDTSFFGFPCYRQRIASAAEAVVTRPPEDGGVVYCFADESNPEMPIICEVLSGAGAIRQPTRVDLAVSTARDVSVSPVGGLSIKELREPTEDSMRLAVESGHLSRFMRDPVFRPRCEELYRRWFENGFLSGGRVYGCHIGDVLAGILVMSSSGGDAMVELLSVDSRFRRHGVARMLLGRAVVDAAVSGAEELVVATQGDNVAALSCYRSFGFAERRRTAIWHLHSRMGAECREAESGSCTRNARHHPGMSIIVPVYNAGRALDRLATSIFRQTSDDYELILVDDGSTDSETLRIEDDICRKEVRAKVIRQKNRGVDAARDAGVAVASGSCVYVCDHDDELHPRFVEYSLGAISNLHLDCLWFRWECVRGDGILPHSQDKMKQQLHACLAVISPQMRFSHPSVFASGLQQIHVDPWSCVTTRELAQSMPFSSTPHILRMFMLATKAQLWATSDEKLYLYHSETQSSMMKSRVTPEWLESLLSPLPTVYKMFADGVLDAKRDPVVNTIRKKHIASCLKTAYRLIQRTGRDHGSDAARKCWQAFGRHVRVLIVSGIVRPLDVGWRKYLKYAYLAMRYANKDGRSGT